MSVDLYTLCHEGMPPRARRSGARRGSLSAQLRSAVREEAQRLGQEQDPVKAVLAVGDTFAALDGELERLALVRLRAVRELRRQGWSYDRIAEATKLSKGRVAQLANDPRVR